MYHTGMKKYFTIQFNDLSDSKKEDMRESLYLDLLKDNKEVNFKDIDNSLEVSWCEFEVSLPDETSEDKWRTDAYLEGGENFGN